MKTPRSAPLGALIITLLQIAAVTALYAVTSVIGQTFATLPPGNVTAIWAPSGIALAAVMLLGYKVLPGVALGSFIGNTNLMVPGKEWVGFAAAAAVGVGAALEAGVGAYALKRLGGRDGVLQSVRSVLVFTLASALGACLINASIGSTAIVLGGYAPAEIHPTLWFTWWLGDAAGVLIVAPAALVWFSEAREGWTRLRVLRYAALLGVLLGVSYLAFGRGLPLEYLTIPVLVLIVFTTGLPGATLGILLVSVIAILGTAAGQGTFAIYRASDQNAGLLLLQAYTATITVGTLTLAALLQQQRRAEHALADVNRSLEQTVSERTRDLRDATQRAEDASRAKSEFLANMSHELRTPLNAVTGYTSIILDGLSGTIDDEARYMLQRVYANSQHLLGLINQILDLSKIEAGRLELVSEAIDVRKLVEQWRAQVGVLAEDKLLGFNVRVEDTLPEAIFGDAERLSQIAINLLSNAIKFTSKGSVTLTLRAVGSEWLMEVTDTGVGIPPHALDVIFEQFRQVDASSSRAQGGTGLGLTIVRNLSRLMGGTVSVQSTVGAGSTFTVRLPLVAATPPAALSQRPATQPLPMR